MEVMLNAQEIELLFRQDPITKGRGGFQDLLIRLQQKTDPNTEVLLLSADDLEQVPRYAFDYGNGGWEDRLKSIFERNLGPKLGRQ